MCFFATIENLETERDTISDKWTYATRYEEKY